MTHDSLTRQYLQESVTCLRSGATRASVIATWVAVQYDILSKARELAAQGEPAAQRLVAEFDAARNAGNVPRLQKLEAELLSRACNELSLITFREHEDLKRLAQDRNHCAHPAFESDLELFDPSPELARVHIVSAANALFARAPVQGRTALRRLTSDLVQASYPSYTDDAVRYLQERYYKSAKPSVARSLVHAAIKHVLSAPAPELEPHNRRVVDVIEAAHAHNAFTFGEHSRDLWSRLIPECSEARLPVALHAIGRVPMLWIYTPAAPQIRLRAAIAQADWEDNQWDLALTTLGISELAQVVVETLSGKPKHVQLRAIAAHPHARFCDMAIQIFSESAGFRSAESNASSLLMPYSALFDADQVSRVVLAADKNGQIWLASQMPELLCEFFDSTIKSLPDTAGAWRTFMTNRLDRSDDETDHYAYPELRQRLATAGLWPPEAPAEDDEEPPF